MLRAMRSLPASGVSIATLVCCSVLFGACAPAATTPVAGPEQTLTRYVAALRAGDADAAYTLLDEETRATVSLDRFRERMAENEAELSEQADGIENALGDHIVARATAPLRDGERAVAVLEAGRWWLLGGVLNAPVLQTPRDAVLSLRRALLRRSLPGTFRVLARDARAELEAEIERFLEGTADELDLDYEVRGNQASVRTTDGRTIRLLREAGEWRVLDIE